MLTYDIKTFSCSKEGHSFEENEDAFMISSFEFREDSIRIAVADGATESSFSKEWGDILVSFFCAFEYCNERFLKGIYPFLRRYWLQKVNAVNLPWYAQQKMEMGAFASFLGIDINQNEGNVNIIAVGDSNLFVFRDDKLDMAFPIKTAEDFGNNPLLISSEPSKNKSDGPLFLEEVLILKPGDIVVLGTDAISQWILKEVEIGSNPINTLKELLNNDDQPVLLLNWLGEQRETHSIKNDDTTIILIQVSNVIA